MDVLRAMRVFRRVVELGGFSAAARDQRLSNAAVSKEVAALEQRLRTKLLHRTTRKVSLTTQGHAYYDRCVTILDDVDDAERLLVDARDVAAGTVRMNAPMSFGVEQVAPLLPQILARHPELRLDVSFTDSFVDVVAEGADLVVRVASILPDSTSLMVQKLARARHVVVASPTYLAAHGEPKTPHDLARHDCLVYTKGRSIGVWSLTGPDGRFDVRVHGRLHADNSLVLRDALVAGVGIGLLPAFYVAPALESGALREVLTAFAPPPLWVHAVHPRTKHGAKRVRVVVDHLREGFARAPWAVPAGRGNARATIVHGP